MPPSSRPTTPPVPPGRSAVHDRGASNSSRLDRDLTVHLPQPRTMTIAQAAALPFATAWFDAWNRHDVEAITSHYAADVEYYSPFVADLAGGSGRLKGLDAVTAYVRAALERFPDLHFEPPLHVAA